MPETPPPLTLRLIGTPALEAGAAAHDLAPVDAVLLAALALDGPTARPALLLLLWPDSPPARAANNLRQRLYRLRRLAGEVVEGDRILALGPDVASDTGSLRAALHDDPAACRGTLLAGLDAGGNEALAARIALWRGRFERERCTCLDERADALMQAGRLTDAIAYAERLLEEDAVSEHAYRRLMRLHYQRGDTAAARAVHARCRRVLDRELGTAPSPETEALAAQLGPADPAEASALEPPPLSLLRPPRHVGRAAARQALERAIAAGGPAVVWGEAGLGKSRLLDEALAQRPRWCRAAALPGDASMPYAVTAALVAQLARAHGGGEPDWARAELARLVPALGSAPADPFEGLRLRQALAAALTAWGEAGLQGVAVDDLHFADAASLELLGPIASRVPFPWIFASRPMADAPPWLAEQPHAVFLEPLTAGDVTELVRSLAIDEARFGHPAPGLADTLWRQSGGNPMALLQILTSRWESHQAPRAIASAPAGAPGVVRIVQARLERLSASARALARLAAAAGTAFSLELAAQVLQVHPVMLADAVRELHAARLLIERAFVHDTVREAVEAETPPEILRLLHRDLARLLGTAGVDVAAATVAGHWERAEDWRQAVDAWCRAAAQARERSGVAEELHALQAAQRCLAAARARGAPAATDAMHAFDLGARAVRLMASMQMPDDALGHALELERSPPDAHRQAEALDLLALVRLERCEFALALTAAQAAMDRAAPLGDARLVLLATQHKAGALMQSNRADDASRLLHAAGPLDSLAPDERLQWRIQQATVYDYADERAEAIAVIDAVIEEAQREGRLLVQAEAWNLRGIAVMYAGRLEESHASLERAMDCARRSGMDAQSQLIEEMSAIGHLRDLGRFDLYLQRAEALPQALRAAGQPFWAANAANDLAVAWAWLGRADLALRALAGPIDELPVPMQATRLFTRARLARDFGLTAAAPAPGEPARLVREAVALLAEAAQQGRSYIRLRIQLESSRELPPAQAAVRAAAIEAEAVQRQNLMLATAAGMLRVRYLGEAGDSAAAAQAARAVLAAAARHGPQAGVYMPELYWTAAQALAREAPGEADAPLRDAVAWLDATVQRVPEPHRRSFLQRNPINAALREAARRRGLLPGRG